MIRTRAQCLAVDLAVRNASSGPSEVRLVQTRNARGTSAKIALHINACSLQNFSGIGKCEHQAAVLAAPACFPCGETDYILLETNVDQRILLYEISCCPL